MPLKQETTTIDNVMVGNNQVGQIVIGNNVVWTNLTSTNYNHYFDWYYERAGGHDNKGDSSVFELSDVEYLLNVSSSGYIDQFSDTVFYLNAKVNASDDWTRIATGNPHFNVAIDNKIGYKYFHFGCTKWTDSHWVNPAGLYYDCNGTLSMTYMARPQPVWTLYSTPIQIASRERSTYNGSEWSGVTTTSGELTPTKAQSISFYYYDTWGGIDYNGCPITIQGYSNGEWVTIQSFAANTLSKGTNTFVPNNLDLICTKYRAVVTNNRVDLLKEIGPITLNSYKRLA